MAGYQNRKGLDLYLIKSLLNPGLIKQWFSTGDDLEALEIFCTTSGDIFDYHKLGEKLIPVGTGQDAKHSIIHKMPPIPQIYLAPNVNSVKAEKSCSS